MSGYIKDYRSELRSDIWLMPPLYHRVWQWLKYKVNHTQAKIPLENGSFLTIQPGQHLTSIRSIAQGVGYYEGAIWKEPNPRTISKILDWLLKQGMISINRGRGNREYTLITLSNWGLYQSNDDEGNSKETASAEGSKQQVHINNNDKEEYKNELIPYVEIVEYLNQVTNSRYRHSTSKTKSLIEARWNEGHRLDDFKTVIDKKSSEWLNDEKMSQYLRPETLFGTKFEGYLNQPLRTIEGGRRDAKHRTSTRDRNNEYDALSL